MHSSHSQGSPEISCQQPQLTKTMIPPQIFIRNNQARCKGLCDPPVTYLGPDIVVIGKLNHRRTMALSATVSDRSHSSYKSIKQIWGGVGAAFKGRRVSSVMLESPSSIIANLPFCVRSPAEELLQDTVHFNFIIFDGTNFETNNVYRERNLLNVFHHKFLMCDWLNCSSSLSRPGLQVSSHQCILKAGHPTFKESHKVTSGLLCSTNEGRRAFQFIYLLLKWLVVVPAQSASRRKHI